MDGKIIGWESLEIPLSNGCSINQELSKLKSLRYWDLLGHDIVMEVFIKKLGSELGVEWSTVRDESACFGDISDKSHLKRFELVGTSDPSVFVVLKGVDKPIGLVHLSSGLVGLLFEGFLPMGLY